MRLILLIALALPALAQVRFPGVTIYPSSNDVSTGQLQFLTRRSDGNSIQIQAPTTGASYTLTLPTVPPASNGLCITGTTAGQLSFGPCGSATVTAATYNWIYTDGAEFTADLSMSGTQSVTVTPCPLGLPGQIYISGGIGTAEVVARTGGTCTNGAASGTLEFTTAETHTGAYTLSSATGGAQEYYSVLGAGSCPVLDLGASAYEFRGTWTISDCATVKASPGATITAYDTNSPAINATYSGAASRTLRVIGSLTINSSGTHAAGSASVYAEGWTDGEISGVSCNFAYRCIDWYANNTGGGNPIVIDKIRSSGTIDAAFIARSAGTGHTAGLLTNFYADGIAATGIKFQGQTAGWTVSNIWIQLIDVGVSFEEVSTRTVNEMTLSGPCLIDGAQSAGVNITSSTSPGTNGIVVDGCFLAMDAGGIPVVIGGMQRVSVKNNWIRQTGANFAIAATASNFLEISNNTINFENNSGAAFGIGLVTTASTDVTVKNNVMRRVEGAGTATGIVFQALSYTAVAHCGNRFYGLNTDISDTSTAGVTVCDTVPDTTPIVSGSADITKLLRFEIDGFTTATTRTLTPQNASYTIAGLNLGQTFTEAQAIISGASGYSVPLTLQNDTVGLNGSCLTLAGHDGASTVRELGQLCAKFDTAAFTDELVSLRTTTGAGTWETAMSWKNDRTTAIGVLTANSHIWTNAPSANDIGDAMNYFQTLYVENIDATAGSVANQYLKARKLEVVDIAGGNGFWDHRSQGSMAANSSYTIRDNAGSRWLAASRAVSGSPTNSTSVFTDWIPSLRSTGSGDAVNDSTRPSLGASGSEWTNIHGTNIYGNLTASTTNTKKVQPDADVTHDLGDATRNYNAFWTKYVEMASGGYIAPQTTNTSSIGRSGYPFNKGWFTDFSATGSIQLKSSSVAGQVWTATDAAGNGTWGAAGGSGTVTSIATSSPISGGTITSTGTISCPTCFTTSGGNLSGGISPNTDLAYNLGSSSFRWNNAYLDFIYLYAGFQAPNGNFGATTTLTCGAGQAVKNITISGGVVTSASCGAP
jgi:hypothetical protein